MKFFKAHGLVTAPARLYMILQNCAMWSCLGNRAYKCRAWHHVKILHTHTHSITEEAIHRHHIVEGKQIMEHFDRAVAAYQMEAIQEHLMYICMALTVPHKLLGVYAMCTITT